MDEDDYVPSEEEAAEDEEAEEDEREAKAGKKEEETKEKNHTLEWDGRVMELNGDNFDHWTEQFDVLMVQIYAPWCGHCKDFKEEYDEAGQ